MKPKFLIVDDDEDILNLLDAMLASFGCDVVQARDGIEVLEILEKESEAKKFDAIFLDLMMPKLSGYAVIEKLKQKPHTANIPVIMLTAKDTSDDMITGYQAGADYYIPKPFTKDQIVYGLDIVLGEENDS